MSEDMAGRRYPFVIAVVGVAPDPGDRWFEGAQAILEGAVETVSLPALTAKRLGSLLPPAAGSAAASVQFWVDDWEVHEVRFSDVRDFDPNGLRAMRAPRPAVGAS